MQGNYIKLQLNYVGKVLAEGAHSFSEWVLNWGCLRGSICSQNFIPSSKAQNIWPGNTDTGRAGGQKIAMLTSPWPPLCGISFPALYPELSRSRCPPGGQLQRILGAALAWLCKVGLCFRFLWDNSRFENGSKQSRYSFTKQETQLQALQVLLVVIFNIQSILRTEEIL